MNSDYERKRKRNQTLLIVEGNHEKNKLFRLLFKCFSEMNISVNDIWIYGTNIYCLYEDIVDEYGDDWAETEEDIDLPFIISRKEKESRLRYKNDFTNIILVFDYERQDPNFSEKKIIDMQRAFSDMTDMGQLYLNYPMIESYLHLKKLPDSDYIQRAFTASLKTGKEYKRAVEKESGIKFTFDFYLRLHELLEDRFEVIEGSVCDCCCEQICNISDTSDIGSELRDILENTVARNKLETAIHQLLEWIHRAGFAYDGKNYWEHVRNIFKEIIYHNIWKANCIQNGQNKIENDKYKDCFQQLDLEEILRIQNASSKDSATGYIWVLNTCIFLVAEYNFTLVEK